MSGSLKQTAPFKARSLPDQPNLENPLECMDSRRQSRTYVLDAEKLCEFRGAQKPSVSDETSASANRRPQKPMVFDGRRGQTSSGFQAAVALVFLISH